MTEERKSELIKFALEKKAGSICGLPENTFFFEDHLTLALDAIAEYVEYKAVSGDHENEHSTKEFAERLKKSAERIIAGYESNNSADGERNV